ncbi:hypothetical protein [Lysinibacillus sphaericus]|uniref:hypothetical protein n=1 Tax=Lysinibacillus sphaericus TaxID=1421 RepID=UPI002DB9917F|nr:hypothetical protein [Lysinibacillus sphaericus]
MAVYGVLILVVAIFLFWSAGLPNIKSKKLTFVMISLGLNVIAPIGFLYRWNGNSFTDQYYE